MRLVRTAIEAESPEQMGYDRIRFNLSESSVRDRNLREFSLDLQDITLRYDDHSGRRDLPEMIVQSGAGLSPDDVLVTPGASAALFFASLSLLEKGDRRYASELCNELANSVGHGLSARLSRS